jgi:hypothetical protein
MHDTLTLIYDSLDIVVAIILGIWFLTMKRWPGKPASKQHIKWFRILGVLAILFAIIRGVETFL